MILRKRSKKRNKRNRNRNRKRNRKRDRKKNRNTRPFVEGKEFFELLEKKCL